MARIGLCRPSRDLDVDARQASHAGWPWRSVGLGDDSGGRNIRHARCGVVYKRSLSPVRRAGFAFR